MRWARRGRARRQIETAASGNDMAVAAAAGASVDGGEAIEAQVTVQKHIGLAKVQKAWPIEAQVNGAKGRSRFHFPQPRSLSLQCENRFSNLLCNFLNPPNLLPELL